MKWLLMCAVLLGLSLLVYAQDEPKPAFDALETSYKALLDKHFPLAVRDVVSKDEAFGHMSTSAECAGLWSAGRDYLEGKVVNYKQPGAVERQVSSERSLAKFFWRGYSAEPGHEVDVAIGKARSYYESLLEAENKFGKEASIKLGECLTKSDTVYPIVFKIRKKLEERMNGDLAARDVRVKMSERVKRDFDYGVEFFKKMDALN